MMLASLLSSLLVKESGVGDEPLYSPYITSPSVAAAAQAVNRSSSEFEMDYSMRWWLIFLYVVAALAFLVWDILITTDEEVTLFSGLIPVALETDLVS